MPELTTVRDLRAGIWRPDEKTGLVVVDGSGDGAFDQFGDWPERLAACGAAVLVHDKPGCGGSPGHWSEQTLDDRAAESLAAVEVLRRRIGDGPVGLFGISQGGWVSLLAAATGAVDFVVTLSGPGVSPAAQERVRIMKDLQGDGVGAADVAEALDWLDERTRRLLTGEPVADVLAYQRRFAGRPWFTIATRHFDTPATMGFLAGIIGFEPATVLPRVPCPVLALFGAADPMIPVPESVAAFATHLPPRPENGIAVFPGADHGLFVDGRRAPGFFPLLTEFLRRAPSGGRRPR